MKKLIILFFLFPFLYAGMGIQLGGSIDDTPAGPTLIFEDNFDDQSGADQNLQNRTNWGNYLGNVYFTVKDILVEPLGLVTTAENTTRVAVAQAINPTSADYCTVVKGKVGGTSTGDQVRAWVRLSDSQVTGYMLIFIGSGVTSIGVYNNGSETALLGGTVAGNFGESWNSANYYYLKICATTVSGDQKIDAWINSTESFDPTPEQTVTHSDEAKEVTATGHPGFSLRWTNSRLDFLKAYQ